MYLFDIDGTLLLTGGAGRAAISQVFHSHFGVESAMQSVSPSGKTDEVIFQECAQNSLGRALSDEELQSLLREYLPLLREGMKTSAGFRLMPFAKECLEYLRVREPLLGIATGNIKLAATAKLQQAGLAKFFDFGGYACDSAIRSELVAVAMERGRELADQPVDAAADAFVVVGDTVFDITAARACGAKVIAVATGHCPAEELRAAGPDALFTTLAELPAWHEKHVA